MALVIPVDHNGVTINVGDTVKLQGIVTKIDTGDTHYGEIYIQVSYPIPGVPQPEVGGFPPNVIGAEIHGPKANAIIQAPAASLTH